MFIAKHNDEEEAREQESDRATVGAPHSRCQVESSCDCRRAATSHLATSRGADNVLSSALAPGLASTLGMFSPVSTGLKSARDPGPSTATVDSDAARVTEYNRGIQSGREQEAHQESMGSSSATLLRQEELIPDSMRKTTLANLETKISDWVSYIPVELHTQISAGTNS